MVFLPWFNLANFVIKQLIVNLKRHPHVVQDFSNDLVKLLRFYTFSPLNVKWFLKYVAVRIHCFTVILCNWLSGSLRGENQITERRIQLINLHRTHLQQIDIPSFNCIFYINPIRQPFGFTLSGPSKKKDLYRREGKLQTVEKLYQLNS